MKYLVAFLSTFGLLVLSYAQDSLVVSAPRVPTDTIDAYLDFAESFENKGKGDEWESFSMEITSDFDHASMNQDSLVLHISKTLIRYTFK